MKGSLHTDELISAVLAKSVLRTGRRMSHVFRFDVPLYHKPLLITDAALNIRPSLQEKVDIIQNAKMCIRDRCRRCSSFSTALAAMRCSTTSSACGRRTLARPSALPREAP